jgi:hypothetical protein
MTFYPRLLAFGAAAGVLAGFGARPARAQSSFPDVPADHWAAAAVQKLKETGIVVGYPPGAPAQRAVTTGYAGDRPVTRYELAVALWRFVQYIERAEQQKRDEGKGARDEKEGAGANTSSLSSGATAVRRLIAGGYLPQNTPLAKEGRKPVTANQLADALSQVIVKATERKTPVTPDSRRAPIERPGQAPGTGTEK